METLVEHFLNDTATALIGIGVICTIVFRFQDRREARNRAAVAAAGRATVIEAAGNAAVHAQATTEKLNVLSGTVKKLEEHTNGMQEALLNATKIISRAEGKAEGIAEEKAQT